MSIVTQVPPAKALQKPAADRRPSKPTLKPQASGLSRDELRQIVLEMIG